MALFTNLQSLSQTVGSNAPDGATDAPSTIDDQLRSLASFIAIERDGGHQWLTSVSGTNTIAGTANGIGAYVAGQTFMFTAAGANTGAATLNVNGLGAKSIVKNGAAALVAGEIPSGATVEVVYNGTNMQLLTVASPASLTTNGYRRDPSGAIEQWGTGTFPASGASTSAVTVTVPLTWPTGLLAVVATPNGAANSVAGGFPAVAATANTTTTITFSADTLGFTTFNQVVTFQWRAVGR